MEIDYIDHYAIITLELIVHSLTHFPTIEMQHIIMSLVCLTINIQYILYTTILA
jgi:hypothetical protein